MTTIRMSTQPQDPRTAEERQLHGRHGISDQQFQRLVSKYGAERAKRITASAVAAAQSGAGLPRSDEEARYHRTRGISDERYAQLAAKYGLTPDDATPATAEADPRNAEEIALHRRHGINAERYAQLREKFGIVLSRP